MFYSILGMGAPSRATRQGYPVSGRFRVPPMLTLQRRLQSRSDRAEQRLMWVIFSVALPQ
jgi:hypothetical protein